jgi:hypothetical protein
MREDRRDAARARRAAAPRAAAHSYPHCWRHKTPVIFRATPQWFISMEQGGAARGALRDIGKVQWTPDWGEQRIAGMIERPSRLVHLAPAHLGRADRAVRAPRAGELHPRTPEIIEQVADRVERAASMRGSTLDPRELLGEEAARYDKVTDIMDVWADSGVSHECVARRGRGRGAGRPVPRGLGPASRLVPQLAADLRSAECARALQGRAHPRLHGRREGPQDVQVARQRDRAAEGHETSAPTCCACGSRRPTTPTRCRLGRDPQAHVGFVPPHPQHRALPARQPRRLRSGARRGAGRTDGGARPLGAAPRARAAGGDRRGLPRATSST